MITHSLLIKYGIPTYFVPIYTDLPATNQLQIDISAQLQTQIGRIYGFSLDTDTVSPANKQLISVNDAMNIYLSLKWGSSYFIQEIRLDNMIYNITPGSTSMLPGERFLPVNVPNDFSLDQSIYINPTGVVGKTIKLNAWYISKISYNQLISAKVITPVSGDINSNQ